MKMSTIRPIALVALALVALALSALLSACEEEFLLPPPDDLSIPEVLRIPPIDGKYLALKAILVGVIDGIRVDARACDIQPIVGDQLDVKCRYPQGGVVEFVGYLSSETKDKVVLGETNENLKQDLRIKYVKFENYHFQAHAGPKNIAAPKTCRLDVQISGEGRIYGSTEHIIKDEERILLSSGGVYQGTFTVTLDESDYRVQFLSPGFYYRRDITPMIIASDPERDDLPDLSALQISLISSGKFDLDGQIYSYQDVFLEIFTADSFWNAECVTDL